MFDKALFQFFKKSKIPKMLIPAFSVMTKELLVCSESSRNVTVQRLGVSFKAGDRGRTDRYLLTARCFLYFKAGDARIRAKIETYS